MFRTGPLRPWFNLIVPVLNYTVWKLTRFSWNISTYLLYFDIYKKYHYVWIVFFNDMPNNIITFKVKFENQWSKVCAIRLIFHWKLELTQVWWRMLSFVEPGSTLAFDADLFKHSLHNSALTKNFIHVIFQLYSHFVAICFVARPLGAIPYCDGLMRSFALLVVRVIHLYIKVTMCSPEPWAACSSLTSLARWRLIGNCAASTILLQNRDSDNWHK